MSSAVEDYIEARNAFEEIDNAIEALKEVMERVSRHLARETRDRFQFSANNINAVAAVLGKATALQADGDLWLAAGEINELLNEWHAKRQAMLDAWDNVPQPELRRSLTEPIR